MPPQISLAVLCLLLAFPLSAQVSESIEVQILEIEATVLDRAGKSVEGLTRDDFNVRIGKRDVPITNFFVVRNGVILSDEGTTEPQTTLPKETSIPTSLVIFIDEVHLSPGSRKRSFAALKRYVSEHVGANASATVVRYNKHFDVRVLPTEKPGYILAELEKIERQPFIDESVRERQRLMEQIDEILNPPGKAIAGMSGGRSPGGTISGSGDTFQVKPEEMFRRLENYAERQAGEVDRTLTAIESAIEIASALTGRKVLLYVSDGLQQQPAFELFEYWDQASRNASYEVEEDDDGNVKPIATSRMDITQATRFDRTRSFQRVVEAAQEAEVAIYAFDAGGLRISEGTGPQFGRSRQTLNTISIASNARSGLQYIAGETGGLYIANDNNIDRVLTKMSEQFTTYYSIGVRPHRGDIRITVKNRPNLRVIATKRRAARTREDRLEQSVRTRLYTRQVENPLNAAFQLGTPAKRDGQCVVPVRLAVPQPQGPVELAPQLVEVRMVMLNEQNDESAVQSINIPFVSGRAVHAMMLRVRPQRHVFSVAVLNPVSGESSFLQGEIDATTCH